MNLELRQEPITARERYAEVRKALRDARKEVLKSEGLNEDSLKELEAAALSEMGEESEAETIHGRLLVCEKPQWMHHNSKLMGYSRFLTFKED